jgi:EmrB/QacA subfamily drug resistance transporter
MTEQKPGPAGQPPAIGPALPGRGAAAEPLDPATIALALVVMLGTVMIAIDTSAVNVALDTLGRDLHASLTTVQWVVTGYLLALGLVMPMSGWAVDRFGAKRCWIGSIVIFVAGSALSGLAWSVGSLIAFRLLQGMGGGLLFPVGQSIVARAAGPKRMGRLMGLMGIPMLLGPVLGPLLGGVLVQNVSWHWIFYINVPVGVIALALGIRRLPATPPRREQRLDLRGLVLASAGVAILIYGISQAGTKGGFGEPGVYGPIAGSAVILVLFAAHSLSRGPDAIIDVRLFANRPFTAASVVTFLIGFSLFGALLILPLYYQLVRGESVLGAGVLLIPQGFGVAASMLPAGRLTDKFGARVVVIPGIALALLGTAAYTQVTAATPDALLALSLFVRGLGLGATMMPTAAAAYATMSHTAIPQAASVINILRQVGGSFGSALLAVILANRAHVAPLLASAFGQTFWVAFAATAVMVIPALFLP